MSNLPHGLGSSVAGQLFYPGPPNVTAYDVAGAHCSRAVEFGEDGTSAATNRLGYALAKNDEYQQARLEAPMARPTSVSWTPSGGSGSSYTFSGVNLFVGDATYLTETQDVRDSLICVLDSNYNELLDTYGNRVCVKSIKNAGETSTIVGDQPGSGGDGNGFYSGGAVIRFKSVNPVNGSEYLPTVDIPDGTYVILVFGIAGTLDTLATVGSEYMMRDALVRGTIRSATHIPAAAFLRDGSRPMLGNINMGIYEVINCAGIRGSGGSPFNIRNTDGVGNRIVFSDVNVSSVSLSITDDTGPYTPGGFHASVLGVLNSSARLNEKLHGNRVISKGGVLDWQTGYLNVPDMVVALNGEAVDVAAQRFPLVGTVSSNVTRYLVLDSTGTLDERVSVSATDAIIAYYRWNGATWDTKVDSRWTFNGTTASFEVTVGPSTYHGADFTSLQEACDFVASIASDKPEGRWTIRICGEVELTDTLDLSAYSTLVHLTIAGDNPRASVVKTNSTFAAAKHLIKINGTGPSGDANRVDFKDLTFKWANTSTNQAAGYGAVYNPGLNTVIQNCLFLGNSTYGFQNAIYYPASSTPTPEGLLIKGCYFSLIKRSIVDANGLASRVMVEDCLAENCSSTQFAFLLTTSGNKVVRTIVRGDVTNYFYAGVRIGHLGEVRGCRFYNAGGTSVTVNNPNTGTVKVDIEGNFFQLVGGSALLVSNTTGQNCHIGFRNNTVSAGDYGVYINNGSLNTGMISITGNRFDGQASKAIYGVDYAREIHIQGNHFLNQQGDLIHLVDNYSAWIEDNRFAGFGALATNFGIKLDGTSPCKATVTNNLFTAVSESGPIETALIVNGTAKVKVDGNRFLVEGAYVLNYFIQTDAEDLQILDNYFDGNNKPTRFILANRSTLGHGLVVRGNQFLNAKTQTITAAVYGYAGSIIEGNTFRDGDNTALLLNSAGTGPVSGSIVRGNAFINITGYRGVGSNAYVTDIGSDTLSSGILIDGNNFQDCGTTQDVYGFGIFARGNGTIRGNSFTNFKGYAADPSTSTAICISVSTNGKYLVEGNKFFQEVNSVMARQMYVINIEETGCTVQGNHCVLTGTLAGWTNGVFRFIRSIGKIYTTVMHNVVLHQVGSMAGTGVDLKAIEVTGAYCMVCLNNTQRYNVVANGDGSVVMGNLVLDANLDPSGSHSIVSGNSIPNGTFTLNSTAHPVQGTQYQSSSKYPGLDANHYSGE